MLPYNRNQYFCIDPFNSRGESDSSDRKPSIRVGTGQKASIRVGTDLTIDDIRCRGMTVRIGQK